MQANRRSAALLALAATIALTSGAPAPAQPGPTRTMHCGPGSFLPGRLDVSVARVDPETAPAEIVVRFLDAGGNPLLESSGSLSSGHSRSLALTLNAPALVRVEIFPVSGPDNLQLRATLQAFEGSSYTLGFLCSGPPIDRP